MVEGNEGILCIPQSSTTAGTSPSDCLVSYLGHSLVGGVLPLCREAVGVFYSPSRLGNYSLEFFTSALADGFWLEFEWQQVPQVSRTLLNILAVLNSAVVWMVSTRPPTSKFSSPFSNPLVTVPNAPITIAIIVTCMFHCLSLLLLLLLLICS